MPTVIDSLVVALGFDPSGFIPGKRTVKTGLDELSTTANKTQKALNDALQKGAKADTLKQLTKEAKEAKQQFKDVNEVLGTGGDKFTAIATKAAGFLAVLGGVSALKRFVVDAIEGNAALERFAKNLQTGVGNIQAWRNATELAGGSAGDLDASLDMLSKEQTNLLYTGESKLIPFFSALGVAMVDAEGNARQGTDVWLDAAAAIERIPRMHANNLGQMFGINQGTMNLLLQGRAAVTDLVAKQKEYAAQTERFAPMAARLNVLLIEGRQAWSLLGLEILNTVTPVLEQVAEWFKVIAQWVGDNRDLVEGFFIGLAAVITAVYLPAMLSAAAATLAATWPIAALSAALALLWEDYQVFKKGGDSLIQWDAAFKALGYTVEWFRDLLTDAFHRLFAFADAKRALELGDWERFKFAAKEIVFGTGKKYGSGYDAEAPKATTPAAPAPARPIAPATAPAGGSYAERATAAGVAPPAGKQTGEQQAIQYFTSQGWTPAQAAGIVANLKAESQFQPDATGDEGRAYGIAQWHPDRQANFERVFGKKIQGSSFAEQLAFVQYELTQGTDKAAGDKLRATTTARDAGEAVSRFYERPGITEAARAAEAQKRGLLAALIGGTPGAADTAQGVGAAATARAVAPGQPGTTSVDTRIDSVNVITQATDAKGIARDMGRALQDYLYPAQVQPATF